MKPGAPESAAKFAIFEVTVRVAVDHERDVHSLGSNGA